MLLGGQIDKDKEYKNINNYYTSHDVLDAVQTSLRYTNRVPGTVYDIRNPTTRIADLIANHKGYPDDKIDGEFKVEIGEKGEVGHGYIRSEERRVGKESRYRSWTSDEKKKSGVR